MANIYMSFTVHIFIIVMLFWWFSSIMSGRLNTEYLFNVVILSLLSSRFSVSA
jgi:hypothetical protein